MGERRNYAYGTSGDYFRAEDLVNKSIRVRISKVEDVEFSMNDANGVEYKGLKPVLSFEGMDKRLVCNATNFDTLADAISSNTENWPGHCAQLEGKKVRFKGRLVDSICLSVPKQAAKQAAEEPPFDPDDPR
jgi:hypothetical protein